MRVRFVRYPGESAKIIFAPVFLAHERGYFRDEGLEVEVVEPPDHPWQCVARGDGEIGVAYIDYCAQPEWRGRITAVAVHERLAPGRGLPALLARPALIDDGTLRDEAGLRGRTLGLTWGRGDDYLTYAFVLRRAGLSLQDVRTVPVPHEGAARDAALECGEIDVIIGRRPRQIDVEERRGVLRRWRSAGEIEIGWQNRFIVFNTDFARRDPQPGAAFLRANQRAVADYVCSTAPGGGDPRFLADLARLTAETPALLADAPPAGFPADCRIDPAALERDLAMLRDAALFPADAGVADVIDDRYAPQGPLT